MAKALPWALPCCIAVTIMLACALTQHSGPGGQSNGDASAVTIDIDLDRGHAVASTLYGIFFEEASASHLPTSKTRGIRMYARCMKVAEAQYMIQVGRDVQRTDADVACVG